MKTVKTLLPLLLAIFILIVSLESFTMVHSEITYKEVIANNSGKSSERSELFSFGPKFLKEKMADLLSKWCAKKITQVINVLDNLSHGESRPKVEATYKKCMEQYKSASVSLKNAIADVKNKNFHDAKDLISQAIASIKNCKDGLHKYDSTSPITKQNSFLFSHLHTLLKIIIELL